MKQTFEHLKTLQETDTDLKTLRARMEEIPGRIERLKHEAEQAKTNLSKTHQAIIDHKKQYKLAEVELKSAEEKVSSYSVQLYSAKTNEQYKAFLKEIENQKKLKMKVEDRMIMLMEEAEALEHSRQTAEKESARLETDTARKVKSLEAEKEELEQVTAERESQRAELAKLLPSNIIKLYERIRKNKNGLAVVTATNNRCNGCLNPIPPQRMLEIERQNRIYTCEACGRILVPDQD
ncbi:hypothetical protein CH330_03195 [candidate division WOR-3 bacterium JGI_Cruoil_03_51_56]|uniref:CT398-like coiled coil hairpin domain-containing protein n=1 Tax=candidate division WOR-3 bacterium JGI_Cruoil_03_51_56 TaxID=1973747 RepID=A0A235BWY1_UNCW3|nr:MAG: hypothetical protein CH330_03195 [candidate division WOR-3 bacterium JGI_Cruoil_03_51_56]